MKRAINDLGSGEWCVDDSACLIKPWYFISYMLFVSLAVDDGYDGYGLADVTKGVDLGSKCKLYKPRRI